MKENWLNDIHDRMSDFETDEPVGLWQQIESQMPKKEKRRVPFLIWWSGHGYAAAVALLVVALGGAGIWLTRTTAPTQVALSEQQEVIIPDNQGNTTPIQPIPEAALPQPTPRRNIAQATPLPEPQPDKPIATDNHQEPPTAPVSEPSAPRPTEEKDLPATLPDIPQEEQPAALESHDRWRGSLALSAYGAGGLNSTTTTTYQPNHKALSASSNGVAWADAPMLGVMLLNSSKPTQRTLTHHIPIRAGVNVAYQLHPRVSLETGVAYACLLADGQEGSADNYIATQQTLHYVGLPLSLRCNIYTWRQLDIYASLGGLAEKCVSGYTTTEYVLSKQTQATETERISDKPWQFSVNLSAGIQYNFTRWAGLYIEPGAAYYFDDRSDLQTVHKQRPFNFNLNLGIRFSIPKTSI